MTLASSHRVRIQICGPLAIESDGQRLDVRLPGRQGRLLFTYLVVNRHRHIPRDELAEALWREPDPAAVDARLNPLLSKLRRVLGTDAVDGRSTLRLCLRDAWVDLEAAADAIHTAESSVAQQDWARAWGPAAGLRDIFAPDVLDGGGELITYCTIGGRAATAWFVLTHLLGRDRVRVYDGSWAEWGRIPGTPVGPRDRHARDGPRPPWSTSPGTSPRSGVRTAQPRTER